MSINGIKNQGALTDQFLKHVFLGEIRGDRIVGYHCDCDIGNDTKVRCIDKPRLVGLAPFCQNRGQKIYKARVVNKSNHAQQKDSTFFDVDWKRQEVVDCINRSKQKKDSFYQDPVTKLIFVKYGETAYPISGF